MTEIYFSAATSLDQSQRRRGSTRASRKKESILMCHTSTWLTVHVSAGVFPSEHRGSLFSTRSTNATPRVASLMTHVETRGQCGGVAAHLWLHLQLTKETFPTILRNCDVSVSDAADGRIQQSCRQKFFVWLEMSLKTDNCD